MWIAVSSMDITLPEGWTLEYTEDNGYPYYWNESTEESSWTNPALEKYYELIKMYTIEHAERSPTRTMSPSLERKMSTPSPIKHGKVVRGEEEQSFKRVSSYYQQTVSNSNIAVIKY